MPSPITNAERARWQLQALTVLGALLKRAAKEGLPPISWTVHWTGSSLVGECLAHPSARRRDDFGAWRAVLGQPDEEREGATPGGLTRLAASWPSYQGVHIALSATIYDEQEESTDG